MKHYLPIPEDLDFPHTETGGFAELDEAVLAESMAAVLEGGYYNELGIALDERSIPEDDQSASLVTQDGNTIVLEIGGTAFEITVRERRDLHRHHVPNPFPGGVVVDGKHIPTT